MSLFSDVKAARMTAMKEKNAVAKSILSTLAGELESNAKRNNSDVTDEQVIQACKKLIQSNKETIKVQASDILVQENEILEGFLPKQLSEDELRAIITEIGASNIGQVMGHLKKNFGGQYDGRMASTIAKEVVG